MSVAALVLLTGYFTLGTAFQPDRLWYARQAIDDGEWWRLLTGHVAHHAWDHLLMNLGAFVMLGRLLEKQIGTLKLAVGLLWIALLTSAGLYILVPQLDSYAGISALNYALLTWWCWSNRSLLVYSLPGLGQTSLALPVLGFLLLRSLMHWQQQALLGDSLVRVAWQAHLLAMLAAAVLLMMFHFSLRLHHERS